MIAFDLTYSYLAYSTNLSIESLKFTNLFLKILIIINMQYYSIYSRFLTYDRYLHIQQNIFVPFDMYNYYDNILTYINFIKSILLHNWNLNENKSIQIGEKKKFSYLIRRKPAMHKKKNAAIHNSTTIKPLYTSGLVTDKPFTKIFRTCNMWKFEILYICLIYHRNHIIIPKWRVS